MGRSSGSAAASGNENAGRRGALFVTTKARTRRRDSEDTAPCTYKQCLVLALLLHCKLAGTILSCSWRLMAKQSAKMEHALRTRVHCAASRVLERISAIASNGTRKIPRLLHVFSSLQELEECLCQMNSEFALNRLNRWSWPYERAITRCYEKKKKKKVNLTEGQSKV